MANEKILVVDDDVNICELLRLYLTKEGYQVTIANDGEEGLEKFNQVKPDMVLLDVMMPRMDGLEVCRRIRKLGNTPVMMLTAKGQKSDRITGFNAGADDYLPKPFDPDELLSRVRAILRRSEAYQPTVLAYGDLTLDPGSGNLSCGKDPIRLSGREFQIMELFMRSPRQVFSAERIMERVWGWGVQKLFRLPPNFEIPFFEADDVQAMMKQVVEQTIGEQDWRPMLEAVREMPCDEDFEKWDTHVRKDFLRK